jgi:hypothetical protein
VRPSRAKPQLAASDIAVLAARRRDQRRVYNRALRQTLRARESAGADLSLSKQVAVAILTCLTRDELVTLRKEIDARIADPSYTPKPFTL